jgi:4,5-dihydroxyphthalate decarboxylase
VLTLSMSCGPYDRARALIDKSVKPDGIELNITVNDDDVDRQLKAAGGDFDICEFFTGTYIADLPFKKLGFTAIPIFVKRMFRHSYIYINKNAGIHSPKDLNGKRVGVQTWITSAALWAKGMLEDDHGVDLASIQWVAWQPVRMPDWQKPNWLNLDLSHTGIKQFDLLARGEIDAAITTEIWAPDRHPDIDFLFPDYGAREREYFKRTRCFPIMHTLLIRDSVLEKNPWVARSIFDAWEASKQILYRQEREWERIHKTSLWYRALWEEERATAGDDIYVWGFAKTRHEVDVMLRYAHRQGVTQQRYQPEDLFWPSMLET